MSNYVALLIGSGLVCLFLTLHTLSLCHHLVMCDVSCPRTGGSIEDAMGMILTPELYSFAAPPPPSPSTSSSSLPQLQPQPQPQPPWQLERELQEGCKLVLVVRTDLGMSPGKLAAQCVHAALGVLENYSRGELCCVVLCCALLCCVCG